MWCTPPTIPEVASLGPTEPHETVVASSARKMLRCGVELSSWCRDASVSRVVVCPL